MALTSEDVMKQIKEHEGSIKMKNLRRPKEAW